MDISATSVAYHSRQPRGTLIIRAMALIIGLMILSFICLLPFVIMRKPWALAIWRRAKLIAILYALIILTSGIVRLITNWDEFYG